jgi:hypothetical protein
VHTYSQIVIDELSYAGPGQEWHKAKNAMTDQGTDKHYTLKTFCLGPNNDVGRIVYILGGTLTRQQLKTIPNRLVYEIKSFKFADLGCNAKVQYIVLRNSNGYWDGKLHI